MINVLADQYLFNIRSFLPPHINLELYDPAQGLPASLPTAQALLIRTVNPINKQTLPTIPENLQFIGTGSAGTDHVDIEYLQANNVAFASAGGCNARSVAEYIATALLLWGDQNNQDLKGLSTGIIGMGHVGTQVSQILKAIGFKTVGYDPPRDIRDPHFESASLQETLSCDILTCHTPLTYGDKHPTYHWLDADKFTNCTFKVVLNAARGGVVNESVLLKAYKEGRVEDFVLDVWEKEPAFDPRIAAEAFIKTPHIAGYSVQAKNNASRLVAGALMDHFELTPPSQQMEKQKRVFEKPASDFMKLSSLLKELHPVTEYDASLQEVIYRHPNERGERFNRLRAEFPLRQEFQQTYLSPAFFDKFPVLKPLGFSVRTEAEKL